MVIYSQIVIWGQSAVCIFLRLGWKIAGDTRNPILISAMVPLGMESGPDVVPPIVYHTQWSQFAVQEAESYSLMFIIVLGVTLISMKESFVERGWISDAGPGVKEQSESFRRADRTGSRMSRSSDVSSPQQQSPWSPSNGYNGEEVNRLLPDAKNDKVAKKNASNQNSASFGTHMSVIFLTAFFSFIFGLFGRIIEAKYSFFQNHNFISGFCLFEVSMCFAFFVMQLLLRHTRINFNRDWFMRVCGLMLDLLVVAALSSAGYFPSANELPSYTPEIVVMIAVCAIWNVTFLFLLGRDMFPNFWFDRSVVLMGDSMGHAFIGLLFARCLDSTMDTPVPAAFAYKLMFIFLPTSAGKNSIVFSLVSTVGLAWSFVLCLAIMAGWYFIFNRYFKPRFIQKKTDPVEVLGDIEHSGSSLCNVINGSPTRRLSITAESAVADETLRAKIPLVVANSSAIAAISSANIPQNIDGRRNPSEAPTGALDYHDRFVTFQQDSEILNAANLKLVSTWLPDSYLLSSWKLAFSIRGDGASLSTLLAQCSARGNSGGLPRASDSQSFLIFIEDSWGYIFGGFLSHGFVNCNEYYGSGEDFVFSVMPTPVKFEWTGENDLFVISSSENFAMGGGGGGFAFQLDDEMATGVSNRSQTYNNPTLSSNEFFKCLNVEVWMLDNTKESYFVNSNAV